MQRLSRLVLRVWIVAVIGVLVTAGLAYRVAQTPGLYFGSADVVFIMPPSERIPNALGVFPGSLVATAGIIQREVSKGPDNVHVVSDNVTIVDEGLVTGVSVTLPNTGGQWANNFERAALHVQAVDADRRVALKKLESTVASISATLAAREDAANVHPDRRIRTEVSPMPLQVQLLNGERSRATAASIVLGLGVTLTLVVLVDPHRRRRRSGGPIREFRRVARRSRSPLST